MARCPSQSPPVLPQAAEVLALVAHVQAQRRRRIAGRCTTTPVRNRTEARPLVAYARRYGERGERRAGLNPLLLRGILSAVLGAVAMTLSSTTEMHLRGRPPSETPGEAGNKLLSLFGVAKRTGESLTLLSTWVHWVYSSLWGIVFWMLLDPRMGGLDLWLAGLLFFALVWGTALLMLPVIGLAPPFWKWGGTEVALDAWHHLVYAAGTVAGWWLIGRAGR